MAVTTFMNSHSPTLTAARSRTAVANAVARFLSVLLAASCSPVAVTPVAGAPPAIASPAVAMAAPARGSERAGSPTVKAFPLQSLEWLENDASRAFLSAKAAHLPVFVDVGASWCHTCKHMATHVFNQAPMLAIAKEAVWLHIDVDRPENELFLRTHAYSAVPTLLLLDADGTERARWVGAMEPSEVAAFVRLGKGGSDLVAMATRASLDGKPAEVLRLAERAQADTTRSPWERLTLATLAVDARRESAAKKQVEHPPENDAENRTRGPGAQQLASLIRDVAARPASEVSIHADDISSAFEALSEERIAPTEVVQRWSAFLEAQAAAATSPAGRAAFDAHRVLAYLVDNTPAKAIPMLEQSAKEFPDDFNPHARLARIYRVLGRLAEAKASIEHARKQVTGPRTLRVLDEQATIAKAAKDLEGERTALRAIVDYGGWLPPGAARAKVTAKRRLDELANDAGRSPQP